MKHGKDRKVVNVDCFHVGRGEGRKKRVVPRDVANLGWGKIVESVSREIRRTQNKHPQLPFTLPSPPHPPTSPPPSLVIKAGTEYGLQFPFHPSRIVTSYERTKIIFVMRAASQTTIRGQSPVPIEPESIKSQPFSPGTWFGPGTKRTHDVARAHSSCRYPVTRNPYPVTRMDYYHARFWTQLG